MKITCNREKMLAAFSNVSGVAPTRSPKPVLQNVKLVANDDEPVLIATDLEVSIVYHVDGIVIDRPGSVLLPPARFAAILKTMRDEVITLSVDDGQVLIKGKHSQFKLPSEDPDLFPEVGSEDDGVTLVLTGSELRQGIKRTAFACDLQSTRYALAGVLCENDGARLTLVGTDGRRLAQQVIACEGVPVGFQPVVPARALRLIEKNINDGDTVNLCFHKQNSISMWSGRAEIRSRLVEGRFPRYQDVFPAGVEIAIPLNVGLFLAAVEQASIVTTQESRGVDFVFSGGKLNLVTKAADSGASDVELDIDFAGSVSITFDPRYLVDALKVLDPDSTIMLEMIDAKNAAIIRTEDFYAYVIMPLTKDNG